MATGGYSKYMHLFEHIFTISYSNAALMKLVIFIMATGGYLDYRKSSPFQINTHILDKMAPGDHFTFIANNKYATCFVWFLY